MFEPEKYFWSVKGSWSIKDLESIRNVKPGKKSKVKKNFGSQKFCGPTKIYVKEKN